jgi:hypothetical protein
MGLKALIHEVLFHNCKTIIEYGSGTPDDIIFMHSRNCFLGMNEMYRNDNSF